MYKLILEQDITKKIDWDNFIKEMVMQHDVIVNSDIDHGTTICILIKEQLLSIRVSPDCLNQPTINVTLVTKED